MMRSSLADRAITCRALAVFALISSPNMGEGREGEATVSLERTFARFPHPSPPPIWGRGNAIVLRHMLTLAGLSDGPKRLSISMGQTTGG
jgi:hypothetical protein